MVQVLLSGYLSFSHKCDSANASYASIRLSLTLYNVNWWQRRLITHIRGSVASLSHHHDILVQNRIVDDEASWFGIAIITGLKA